MWLLLKLGKFQPTNFKSLYLHFGNWHALTTLCLSLWKYRSSYVTPVLFQCHKITASQAILSWKDHEDQQSSAPGPSIQVVIHFSHLYFAQDATTQNMIFSFSQSSDMLIFWPPMHYKTPRKPGTSKSQALLVWSPTQAWAVHSLQHHEHCHSVLGNVNKKEIPPKKAFSK